MSEAQYSYLATDLVTGAVLGELPINGVSLDCQLNSAGNMEAAGKLDDLRISNEDFIARTEPGKTAFWAYRDNQIVWGGIIWTRQWQSNGKSLTITGQTFESYATRRVPRTWIGTGVLTYTNKSQCFIIDQLWQGLQSVANGSIGVAPYGIVDPTDTKIGLTINGYDLSVTFDDVIQSILTLDTGPDYTIVWQEDGNGLPLKQLLVKPRIGNPIGATDLVVDYPGAVADYQYMENSSNGNNKWWASGDGTDAAQTTGVAIDQLKLNSGYPLLEGVNSYSGVTDQSTIDAHASSDLAALPVPLVTHAADLEAQGMPKFGSYGMGDYVQMNVLDPRFPRGQQFQLRVIGWTIQPPDEDQGTEQINLVFDENTGSGGS